MTKHRVSVSLSNDEREAIERVRGRDSLSNWIAKAAVKEAEFIAGRANYRKPYQQPARGSRTGVNEREDGVTVDRRSSQE